MHEFIIRQYDPDRKERGRTNKNGKRSLQYDDSRSIYIIVLWLPTSSFCASTWDAIKRSVEKVGMVNITEKGRRDIRLDMVPVFILYDHIACTMHHERARWWRGRASTEVFHELFVRHEAIAIVDLSACKLGQL